MFPRFVRPHSGSAPHSFIPDHWSGKNDSRGNSRLSAWLLKFSSCRHQISLASLAQNTLARVVAQKSRNCHITPVLAGLHWLPVCHRINFKIATTAFKVLHHQQPCSLVPCSMTNLLEFFDTVRDYVDQGAPVDIVDMNTHVIFYWELPYL